MSKFNNRKRLMISLLVLFFFAIGVVYAYLTSNLSITGATEIAANSWDIHFANLAVSEGSVSATTPAAINPSDDTEITYTVKLNRPKEYYEFTVDVVNEGSLPGKVSISSLSGITAEAEDIVDYSISYTNGRPVQVNDILNAGATKHIKVRVYYNDEIDIEDLPSTNLNLTLTYTLQYVQSEFDEFDTNALINQLKTENTSCFTKYEGQVTDQVGETVTASNIYFNKCFNARNVIFAGYCWQMIRTTETGGIKMIYNGDVVDGKCLNTRGDHKGIVGALGSTQTLNAEYLYGSTFTYDTTNNNFTLMNATTATWSDSTYENLLGKFTCKNTSGTCTTLYSVNGYINATTANTSSYTIGDTNYASIGTSAYNANYRSPAMVGYMFNKVYNYKTKSISGTNKFGSTFTYDNGTYTISGTTQDLTTLSGANIDNTHYTCWNDTGTCSDISYVYYIYSSTGYYIEISDGKSVSDALDEMLYSDDVNTYNSSIKGIIDSWYAQNLSTKTNILEDTVYCNARNMSNQSTNGWNPEGGSTSTYMYFKDSSVSNNMSCSNITDQFSVGNNKAKLTYPVALATHEELYTLTNNNTIEYYDELTKTGASWWELSLGNFSYGYAIVLNVDTVGNVDGSYGVYFNHGVRFVVTLSPGTVISGGSGTIGDPFVISE